MKQTVEEAAREHQTHFEICDAEGTISGFINGVHKQSYESFISGAEWQAKQSPWVSVKDRLPEAFEPNLILLKDGQVRVASLDFQITCFWYDREADESFDLEDVVAFMPIPSFDEILEANKDVLDRIKEKGD